MRGDRLKQLRLLHSHSQESLAELLGIGNRQIWRYENGETEPDGQIVAKIAQVFDVSTDYLLGLTDDPNPKLKESDLQPKERAVIAAWRQGDFREAIRGIVNDE